MKQAKWLIREKSTNTIYTYYTFEILSIDITDNVKESVDIYEISTAMGKVNYNLTTIEEIRKNNTKPKNHLKLITIS